MYIACTKGGGGGGGGGSAELALPTRSQWKKHFALGLIGSPKSAHAGSGELEGWWEDPSDPTRVLAACGQDLMRLWTDENVRTLLRVMKIRLEEMPGL